MKSPSPKRTAQTRRILGATRSRVANGGIDGLSMAAIAQDVGMTAAALYRYFPNKGALLARVNAEIIRDQRSVLIRLERLVQTGSEPNATLFLQSSIEVLLHLATEDRESFALLTTTLVDPRVLVKSTEQAVHIPELLELRRHFEAMMKAAQEQGQLRAGDPHSRVYCLLFGCLGILQTHKLARFEPELDLTAQVRKLTIDLLSAWGGSPRQLRASAPHAQLMANRALLEVL